MKNKTWNCDTCKKVFDADDFAKKNTCEHIKFSANW